MCSLFAQPSQSIEYLEYLETSLVPRGFCVCFGTMVLENEMFSFAVGSEFFLAFFPKPAHPVAEGEST